jgi:hypothetical protein
MVNTPSNASAATEKIEREELRGACGLPPEKARELP